MPLYTIDFYKESLNTLKEYQNKLEQTDTAIFENWIKEVEESFYGAYQLNFKKLKFHKPFYLPYNNNVFGTTPNIPTCELIENDFLIAKSIISDHIFFHSFSSNDEKHIKAIKLFESRKEDIDFDIELSKKICGDNTNYPYRSSYFLTKFFNDLGLNHEHDGSTRRFWVENVIKQYTVLDLIKIIENGLFKKKYYTNIENENFKENFFEDAIKDFKSFINQSISSNESINLIDILDLNINIELLFDKPSQTNDDELNKLIEEAKSRFLKPNDKQIALEKLWDAFERIKTYFQHNKSKSAEELVNLISGDLDINLLEAEFKSLTKIGNDYRIRHHETNKVELKDVRHINYLFFRMLSLLDLCLSYLNKNINDKIDLF